ncbi:MAG: hypothetical protein AAFR61_04365 [Bacteroidota bacterium]
MKSSLLLSLTLAFLLLGAGCQPEKPEDETAGPLTPVLRSDEYTPIPAGFDYPLPQEQILGWVNAYDLDSIRNHAWNLWAGVNQLTASGEKVWETWHPIYQVMPPSPEPDTNGLPNLDPNNKTIPQYETKHPCKPGYGRFLNVPLILTANIFYNDKLINWIREKGLHRDAVLDSMLKAGMKEVPHAPHGAMIIKHVYWPVSKYKEEFSVLPMWDGPAGKDSNAYNGFETWDRAVALTMYKDVPDTVSGEYLWHVANREDFNYRYEKMSTVHMDRFYTFPLNQANLALLSESDKCIISNCFNQAFNRDMEEGDALVSLGMHILSKEIPDWAMQTAWWHDKPDAPYNQKYSANKPTNLPPGPWQNYVMSTAYFMSIPNAPGGEPHIAFSPYIECVIPEANRINSNCQNCHIRAAHPTAGKPFYIAHITGQEYEAPNIHGAFYDCGREGFISTDDPIFKGLIRTDFNWSIPDRSVEAKQADSIRDFVSALPR